MKPDRKISIAMVGNSNNPFADEVQVGFRKASAVLGPLGVKLKWITAGSDVTVTNIGSAINSTVVQRYSGVAALLPGDGICPYIKTAVAKGLAVAGWNGTADCAQPSGALFYLGADMKDEGTLAAKQMCAATKTLASSQHPGKVGIITQSFAFQAQTDRRVSFIDGLKQGCPWVTPVNEGVQDTNADPTLMTSQTNSFIAGSSNLVGIYVTGGNPYAAGQAVGAAKKSDKVKVVAYDFTPQNVSQLKKNNIYALIGQDPFGQGYNTMIELYNYIVTKQRPPQFSILLPSTVATKANIDAAVKRQGTGNV